MVSWGRHDGVFRRKGCCDAGEGSSPGGRLRRPRAGGAGGARRSLRLFRRGDGHGIVSAVLRQHGRLVSSAVLPAITAGCFAVLAAASAWRAAAFPAELCGDLRCTGRAFTSFAFVAARRTRGPAPQRRPARHRGPCLGRAAGVAGAVLPGTGKDRLPGCASRRSPTSAVTGTWGQWAPSRWSSRPPSCFRAARSRHGRPR